MKRQHGVAIAIKVENGVEIEEVLPVSNCCKRYYSWMLTSNHLLLCSNWERLYLFEKPFYNKLNKQFVCEKTRKVICLGDFNATSSATLYNSSLRENTLIDDLVVNDNGLCFHEFFNRNRLSVLNTWFTHKKCRRITWHSPDGVTKKVYDFVLSCNWLRQYIWNCRVYNSFDIDSDHQLVIADIGIPSSKIGLYVLRKKTQKNNALNLKCLREPLFHNAFIKNAATKLEQIDLFQTSNSWNQWNVCHVY